MSILYSVYKIQYTFCKVKPSLLVCYHRMHWAVKKPSIIRLSICQWHCVKHRLEQQNMASSSTGMDSRKKGTVAEVLDASLSAQLFNLLLGQERSAMPTAMAFAHGHIWKRLPLSVGH